MGSLQTFQSALQVDFPVDVADQILGRIQNLYGTQFDKHYGHLEPQELQHLACTVLTGVTPNDLKRGLERMNSEKWCPTLPEFRSWCISNDWWSVETAWARTLNFVADESNPITTLAKAALDEVRNILNLEGQKAAHFAFRDIYDDYLQRAKKQGRVQEMWKPKQALTHEPERHHKPVKVDLKTMMRKAYLKAGRA